MEGKNYVFGEHAFILAISNSYTIFKNTVSGESDGKISTEHLQKTS